MITIPVATEQCAGIDVGKRGLAAAVAVGPADKEAEIKTRWFATTIPALRELPRWLREEIGSDIGPYVEPDARLWKASNAESLRR